MKTKQTGLSTFETLAGAGLAAVISIAALNAFSKVDSRTESFTTNKLSLVEQLEAGHTPCLERTPNGHVLCTEVADAPEQGRL